jgi:hypothetical protein
MIARAGPAAAVELLVLTRMELARLFRTEQVYAYLLLPALLILPAAVFGTVLVTSASGPAGKIALCADLPPELDLARHLRDAHLDVVVLPDPRAAWEARRVDAAIVAWHEGSGIGAADPVEPSTRDRWRLDLLVDDEVLAANIRGAVDDAGEAVVSDWVALAGGAPAHVVDVVDLVTIDHPDRDATLPFDPLRAGLAYGVCVLGFIGFFFLTLPSVADRRDGVTETLRALPISPTRLVWARVLALVALQALTAALLLVNGVLLLAQVSGSFGFGGLWGYVPGVLAVLVAIDALYATLGILAPSARMANNLSSLVMTSSTGLLVWGAVGAPPVWVPLAGLLVAKTPSEHAIVCVAALGVAALAVAIAGHLLATRVSLVLPRGEA